MRHVYVSRMQRKAYTSLRDELLSHAYGIVIALTILLSTFALRLTRDLLESEK